MYLGTEFVHEFRLQHNNENDNANDKYADKNDDNDCIKWKLS